MRGFSDTALVLFPKPESYENRTDDYHYKFKKAVNNLSAYLNNCDMKIKCFATDEVSLISGIKDATWIQTLNDADKFFMMTHNVNMTAWKWMDLEKVPEKYDLAAKKFPLERGLTADQRFEVLVKRENLITKELIKEAKVVINFEQPNNPNYKVVSKEDDAKICIIISNRTFLPKCYLSGNEIDPNDLLAFQGANRPIYSWEV